MLLFLCLVLTTATIGKSELAANKSKIQHTPLSKISNGQASKDDLHGASTQISNSVSFGGFNGASSLGGSVQGYPSSASYNYPFQGHLQNSFALSTGGTSYGSALNSATLSQPYPVSIARPLSAATSQQTSVPLRSVPLELSNPVPLPAKPHSVTIVRAISLPVASPVYEYYPPQAQIPTQRPQATDIFQPVPVRVPTPINLNLPNTGNFGNTGGIGLGYENALGGYANGFSYNRGGQTSALSLFSPNQNLQTNLNSNHGFRGRIPNPNLNQNTIFGRGSSLDATLNNHLLDQRLKHLFKSYTGRYTNVIGLGDSFGEIEYTKFVLGGIGDFIAGKLSSGGGQRYDENGGYVY